MSLLGDIFSENPASIVEETEEDILVEEEGLRNMEDILDSRDPDREAVVIKLILAKDELYFYRVLPSFIHFCSIH